MQATNHFVTISKYYYIDQCLVCVSTLSRLCVLFLARDYQFSLRVHQHTPIDTTNL